ncbi:MAG: hypothetical protein JWN15_502, partial [Firmicutes bacterium]|nr:hypothetical protein [Bacillota bacterium]
FVFILGYAPLLSLGALMAGDALSASWPLAAPVGVLVAWGQLIAGLLDMVENVALMRTVLSPKDDLAPRVARGCARGKFSLITLGVTFISLGLICWGLQ